MFHYGNKRVHEAIEGNEREAASEVPTSTPEPRGRLLSHNTLSIRNFTVKQIGSVQRRAQIATDGLELKPLLGRRRSFLPWKLFKCRVAILRHLKAIHSELDSS